MGWRMAKKPSLARANAQLRVAIRQLHETIDAHQASDHDFGRISCRKGCTGCCRQLVLAELSEAEYILARNPEVVERVLPKLVEHAQFAAQLPDTLASEEAEHAATEAYWQRNLPCAFLEDGLCSVYEDRPLPCRTHFVLSDPALCATDEISPTVIADFGTRTQAPQRLMQLVSKAKGQLAAAALPILMVEAVRLQRTRKQESVHG